MTAWLPSVRLATTANLADNGGVPPRPLTPATLDGVTVTLGSDEILVKDQTDATQNGTWVADAIVGVAMTRRADTFEPESTVRVSEGDRNAHTAWALLAPAGAITVGTDPLPFLRQDVKSYSVDSIAELKTLSAGVLVGATASVGGYYEAGDQGGGNFTFVGTPSAAMSIDAATPPDPVSVDVNAVNVVDGVVTIETTTAHGLPVAVAGPPTVASVYLWDGVDGGAFIVTVKSTTEIKLRGIFLDALPAWTTVSYVTIATAAAHGRDPGQPRRLAISGVVASGAGVTPINGVSGPGGVIDATTLSLPVLTDGSGTYAPGPSAVIGDDALFVGATDGGGATGGLWQRTQESGVFNVRSFGARGDGSADASGANTAALQAAIAAATALSGYGNEQPAGIVHFPGGKYNCSRQIAFDTASNVVWRGPAQINFTGAGDSPFIALLSVAQFSFRDLIFTYDDDLMGRLITTGNGNYFPLDGRPSDGSSLRWDGCQFAGIGVTAAACLLALPFTHDCRVKDSTFTSAQLGLRGVDNGNAGASNTVLVDRCVFAGLVASSIFNAGEAWTILNSTFEPLAGALGKNAYTQDLDYNATNFSFIGNWCGDADVPTDTSWITGRFLGASINGNLLSTSDPDPAIVIAGSNGVAISGNRIAGSIDFERDAAHGASTGIALFGNTIQSAKPYRGVADNVSGLLTRFGNQDNSLEDQISLPVRFGEGGTAYGRVNLGMDVWTPGTVAAGSYLDTAGVGDLVIIGALLGDAVSLGISADTAPPLPSGVIASVAMAADGVARVTIQNLTGASVDLDQALTIRVHAVRSPPFVASVDANVLPATTITINGNGFQPDATIDVGGIAAAPTWLTTRTMQCQMPASPPGPGPGASVDIVVHNPDSAGGESSQTGVLSYTYP